jgi:hypothetical protein
VRRTIGVVSAVVVNPAIVVTTAFTFFLGLLAARLALRVVHLRSRIASLPGLAPMVLLMVQAPALLWTPVPWLARVFPLTHSLEPVRLMPAAGPLSPIAGKTRIEAFVGRGWLIAAAWAFLRFAENGRPDGSIEFGG